MTHGQFRLSFPSRGRFFSFFTFGRHGRSSSWYVVFAAFRLIVIR